MTKVVIISGFLGAGKTTFIKKLLEEVYKGQKVVLIENEFGEIGIDGGFLKEAGVEITEMNSGCICCSLVGDFGEALTKVAKEYEPELIIIEPSGVGKLSDVIAAVEHVKDEAGLVLENFITVADGTKCKMYMKNFGEFYNNQIENASTVVLSRTQNMTDDKLEASVKLIHEQNEQASIITTPWSELKAEQIKGALLKSSLVDEMLKEAAHHQHHEEEESCGCGGHDHDHEHHHHHEDGEACGCGGHDHDHEHHHHHEDGEACGCGGHDHDHEHHHEDGEACGCGCGGHDHDHEHHHEDGEACGCGCGGHDHDHEHHHEHGESCGCGHDHDHEHHHAEEVFNSWGVETPHKYDKEEIEQILKRLVESMEFGFVLRAKGMVPSKDGSWIYFDAVPGEYELRDGSPDYTGKLCVIGTDIEKEQMETLFGLR